MKMFLIVHRKTIRITMSTDFFKLNISTIETCEKKEILLAPPVFELPLGDVPRDKYPLVVLLYNPEAIRDDVAMTTELCHQVVSDTEVTTHNSAFISCH